MAILDPSALLFLIVPLLGAFVVGRSAKSTAGTIASVVLPMGVVGTIISLVIMLQSLDDPSAVGSAMAAALLPALYAGLIKLGLDVYGPEGTTEREQPPLGLSAAGVALWLVAIIAFFMLDADDMTALIQPEAMAATLLSVIGIVVLTKASGSDERVDRLARYLPYAGLLIFFAGVVGILDSMNDPAALGPYMALSLLGLLYATTLSVCLKLARPDLVATEPPTPQWLFWGASIAGISFSFGMVLVSISAVS